MAGGKEEGSFIRPCQVSRDFNFLQCHYVHFYLCFSFFVLGNRHCYGRGPIARRALRGLAVIRHIPFFALVDFSRLRRLQLRFRRTFLLLPCFRQGELDCLSEELGPFLAYRSPPRGSSLAPWSAAG